MSSATQEFLTVQSALIGEYSLQRELGRGGMGVVYLARDVQLDRDVAIKVLPPELAANAVARERFLREARTAAGLSHPHIVPIHRVGEAQGVVFFVMSYIAGETLGQRLRTQGPLPPGDVARVLREVAWALAYAHGRGIVHRDIKPDNILIEEGSGRAMVTDFGIASDMERAALTPAPLMGTAHYISPEHASGAALDGRSDLYALGVVGYLALSGRYPFDGETVPALLLAQATQSAPSLRTVAPGVPAALEAAIARCLARDPAERFADGEALAAALAPAPEPRSQLAPGLRAWLAARNPLMLPYSGWMAGFSVLTAGNLVAWVTGNRPDGPADIALLAGIAAAPLLPIIGYHINQARRQFRAGHSLADLRAAIDVARRERVEAAALSHADTESPVHRALRYATFASTSWLAVTVGLVVQGVLHENRSPIWMVLSPVGATLLTVAVSNALDVRFVSPRVREWWMSGIRDRLWNSRVGAWLSRKLGAPSRSRALEAGGFRATEVALGVAAQDLYEALPSAQREALTDLPATLAALEAEAADARAAVALLDGAAREAAAQRLARAVAALETLRLDLLRLHAGSTDLAPLTTLIDAVRHLGDEVDRLVDARADVDRLLPP
ncbi:serine/threonine-protein kinase [Gemmatimonas sp. UBA7669]|uniref:serine/threonine-protein kinase n=1 Tax=Gemmatimonas sp. UBA7669 TaxID=1946568 RepID=UPI0025BD8216|nr:serine/threonine-protein kinase [Gemmatimonas sp. UBA7669]